MMKLFRVPAVLVTGLVIAVVSSTWAFLDPTLEPHLREVALTRCRNSFTKLFCSLI